MPRKGPAPKHPVVVDPVYGSPLVTSLINKILIGGKRSVAERIVVFLDLVDPTTLALVDPPRPTTTTSTLPAG